MTLRKKLRELFTLEFGAPGIIPRGDAFKHLVQITFEAMPGCLDHRVLEDSLRHLAGVPLTPALIDATAWRLAGNVPRLRCQKAVTPWAGQYIREWVPTCISYCRRMRQGRSAMGALFGFKIQAGTACTLTVYKWWSLKQCRFYSRGFGFSRSVSFKAKQQPKYPYSVPEQLVGLCCYVLLEPELCDQEPHFEEASWPNIVRPWNKEQLKLRFRVDQGYSCPQYYPVTFPCHKCPHGIVTCAAATHKEDWTQGKCPDCKQVDAYFDPELSDKQCIDCFMKGVHSGH